MADKQQLRELAQRRVQRPQTDTLEMSPEESARLVYELEIHQEELEIQNEELRRAHLELRDSRDRYVDLYDFAPVGYLTFNAEGEIVEANLKACELLDRERSRLIGLKLAMFCDLNSRAALQTHLQDVLSTGDGQSTELQLSTGNATYVQLESCRSNGQAVDQLHCRTIVTDITDRKHAERALAEKDEQLRALTDALPVLISYLDRDFRFRFCNAAYENWFGSLRSDLIGHRIQHVITNRIQEFEDYLADVLTGRRVDFESQLSHHRHGQRQVHMMFIPDIAADGDVRGIHSLCIDITERKLIEQQNLRRRDFSERLVRLNPAETQVYDLLVRGKSNKSIASQLDMGLRTIERRRQTIFEKLEVESLADLLQQLSDIQNIRSA